MGKEAVLDIEFYDDPSIHPNMPAEAWLSLLPYSDIEIVSGLLSQYFCLFYSKIIYNLGSSPTAIMLRNVVETAFREGISKDTNLLIGDNYAIVLCDKKTTPTKTIQAIFFENGRIKTKFSRGGEGFYAPMGVIAFLQEIVNALPEDDLEKFCELCMLTLLPGSVDKSASAETVDSFDNICTWLLYGWAQKISNDLSAIHNKELLPEFNEDGVLIREVIVLNYFILDSLSQRLFRDRPEISKIITTMYMLNGEDAFKESGVALDSRYFTELPFDSSSLDPYIQAIKNQSKERPLAFWWGIAFSLGCGYKGDEYYMAAAKYALAATKRCHDVLEHIKDQLDAGRIVVSPESIALAEKLLLQ